MACEPRLPPNCGGGDGVAALALLRELRARQCLLVASCVKHCSCKYQI